MVDVACQRHRGGNKILHLTGANPVFFEIESQIDLFVCITAWMRRDKVGNQILFQTGFGRFLPENPGKLFVIVEWRFTHDFEHFGRRMFRRYF